MNEKTLSDLSKQHSLVRLSLLASLIFFAVGLFALVSKWDSAVPVIIFSCLFRLVAVGLARRRYNISWMRESSIAAAEKKCGPVTYTARETVSQTLVTELGIAPDVRLTPNTFLFHALRGSLSGLPFCLGETAFVRLSENGKKAAGRSVAGSLITVENALPADEKWVLLKGHPLDGFFNLVEYDPRAWKQVEGSFSGAACFSDGGSTECSGPAAALLGKMLNQQSAVLAASEGKLSLLLPGSFYARKADITKAPTQEMLDRAFIPALDLMEYLLETLRKQEESPE